MKHTTLDAGILSDIQSITEGWIAGIILYFQALQTSGKNKLANLPDGFAKRSIFEYFFSELLKSTDDDFKFFLLKTSFLSEFTAEDVFKIFHIDNSNAHILRCMKQGYYIQFIKQKETLSVYRFHALFREALTHLRNQYFSVSQCQSICLQAAEYYAKGKDLQTSVDILIAGGQKAAAITLLESEGQNLLNTGQIEQIRNWLGKLDDSDITNNPYLNYYSGYVMQHIDLKSAIHSLYKAADGFADLKNYGMQARALITIATIYSLKNDVKHVKLVSSKIPALHAFLSDRWSRGVLMVSALTQMAWDDKLVISQPLIKLLARVSLDDDWMWAYFAYSCMIDYRLSKLDEAESIILKAFDLDLLKRNEIWRGYGLVLYHTVLYLKGDETKAPAVRSELLDIGNKYGSDYLLAYGKRAYAFSRYFNHDTASAVQLIDESTEHFHKIENEAMVCLSVLDRCLWLAEDMPVDETIEKARTAYTKLIALNAGQGLAETGQTVFGAAAALAGKPEYALELLKDAAKISKRKHANQVYCGSILNIGHSYLLLGQEKPAEKMIKKAMNMAKDQHYYVFWDMNLTVLLRSLIFAVRKNICTEYAYQMVQRYFGKKCANAIKADTKNTVDLLQYAQSLNKKFGAVSIVNIKTVTVRTFGSFAIEVNGTAVVDSEWKTRKVLGVLKYLILRQGSPVSRDTLIDAFWPDSDSHAAFASLRAALYELRKVLNRFGLNAEGAFPLVAENRYGLYVPMNDHIIIDCVQFRSIFEKLKNHSLNDEERTELLAQAFALYQGPLMSQDIYDDWFSIERENYNNMYVTLALEYFDVLESSQKTDQASQVLDKLIMHDPLCEEANYKLVRLYLQSGLTNQAHLVFDSYKHSLKENLDLEPDDKISALFSTISQQK